LHIIVNQQANLLIESYFSISLYSRHSKASFSYKYEILPELNKTNLNMPELPAYFQDYNHIVHSFKTRPVLYGSTGSLQTPDNNQKITT